ncbi:MAG: fumarate hydratase, partial [Magnetococcus sp. WYHC-3]
MAEFVYADLLPLGHDATEYRLLTREHVTTESFSGGDLVRVAGPALELLARTAFADVSHLFRASHLAQLRAILDDAESSPNDRYVALELLKNACVASAGVLPSCQDTGTALVMGKKGQRVWTDVEDRQWLSQGIYRTYTETNLRYSQVAPLTLYEEKNTGTNLPAQIDIEAVPGSAYKFLFMAKGGGSANKT